MKRAQTHDAGSVRGDPQVVTCRFVGPLSGRGMAAVSILKSRFLGSRAVAPIPAILLGDSVLHSLRCNTGLIFWRVPFLMVQNGQLKETDRLVGVHQTRHRIYIYIYITHFPSECTGGEQEVWTCFEPSSILFREVR